MVINSTVEGKRFISTERPGHREAKSDCKLTEENVGDGRDG